MLRQAAPALLRPFALTGRWAPITQSVTTSAGTLKASEPAFADEHEGEEANAFQSKIKEVLNLKDADNNNMWCTERDMVINAVRKMTNHNVGSLLVFSSSKVQKGSTQSPAGVDSCVGIVTERDYLTKVVVEGRNSANTPVAAIMTPAEKLAVLTPEHSVLEAMELMVKHNVRHVPVMDKHAMVGILSIKDVVKVLLHDQQRTINSLRDYIHGTY